MAKKEEVKPQAKGKENITVGEAVSVSGFIFGILSVLALGIAGVGLGIVGLIISITRYITTKSKVSKVGIILNIIGIIVSGAYLWYAITNGAL